MGESGPPVHGLLPRLEAGPALPSETAVDVLPHLAVLRPSVLLGRRLGTAAAGNKVFLDIRIM